MQTFRVVAFFPPLPDSNVRQSAILLANDDRKETTNLNFQVSPRWTQSDFIPLSDSTYQLSNLIEKR